MPANYKPFDKEEWLRLEKKADELRRLTVQTTVWGGSGHIGGAMSAMDAMTILYHRFMKLDVNNPDLEDRDRFVLSKGHAAVGYGPVICDYGFMDVEGLHNFNLTGSLFGMHLDCNKIKGVDCSSGSLGHGLSLACGFACRYGTMEGFKIFLCHQAAHRLHQNKESAGLNTASGGSGGSTDKHQDDKDKKSCNGKVSYRISGKTSRSCRNTVEKGT